MRNRLNVIQINGIKGIIFLAFAAVCLAVGFIVFPGIVLKSAWNIMSGHFSIIPTLGIIQGILLWGIVVVSYFTFKKKGFFVELKSMEDLSRAEMDAVMHRIRTERQADIISKSIMRARELDTKMHNEMDKFIKNSDTTIISQEQTSVSSDRKE